VKRDAGHTATDVWKHAGGCFFEGMKYGVDAAGQQQPGSAAAAVQCGHSTLPSFVLQYQGGQMGSGMMYSNTGAGSTW
jgi:hypothetical protein